MTKQVQFAKVHLNLYKGEDGGRPLPISISLLSYILHIQAMDDTRLTSIEICRPREPLHPGSEYEIIIYFMHPANPFGTLEVDSKFYLHEGKDRLGEGVILSRWVGTELPKKMQESYDIAVETVRLWGYDENAWLKDEDEDLVLYKPKYIPVLTELAADDKCPKQQIALQYLYLYARNIFERQHWRPEHEVKAFEQAAKNVITIENLELNDWANYILQRI
ncbi:MAG: hypothetical protein AAF629_06660 [Chloroflexota bacterium]